MFFIAKKLKLRTKCLKNSAKVRNCPKSTFFHYVLQDEISVDRYVNHGFFR